MRQKRLLAVIKVYEYNTDGRFYRAECKGMSDPSSTPRGCILKLIKNLEWLKILPKGKQGFPIKKKK